MKAEAPELSVFPNVRQLDSFELGQQVFVPRTWDRAEGLMEASLGEVVAVIPSQRESSRGENQSPGLIKVLTDSRNRLPISYFVGEVNHAGIIPVQHAMELSSNDKLQQEWVAGAQWPKGEDWKAYAGGLLANAMQQLASLKSAQEPLPFYKNAGRHAHHYHKPTLTHQTTVLA
jgi:hypothetical protein